jgi:hypothetical protein
MRPAAWLAIPLLFLLSMAAAQAARGTRRSGYMRDRESVIVPRKFLPFGQMEPNREAIKVTEMWSERPVPPRQRIIPQVVTSELDRVVGRRIATIRQRLEHATGTLRRKGLPLVDRSVEQLRALGATIPQGDGIAFGRDNRFVASAPGDEVWLRAGDEKISLDRHSGTMTWEGEHQSLTEEPQPDGNALVTRVTRRERPLKLGGFDRKLEGAVRHEPSAE